MRIGKLRHRITIECVVETQDADGAVIETWSTYETVQASIDPISGREYFAAQSTQADVTHRICIDSLSRERDSDTGAFCVADGCKLL